MTNEPNNPKPVGVDKSQPGLLWAWLAENEKQVKFLLAIFVALYAIWEYRAQVDTTRTERTLKYVERSASEPIYAFAKGLNDFYFSEDVQGLGRENYVQNFETLFNMTKLQSPVRSMLGFYSEMATCVDEGACKRGPACSFFFDDIQSFRQNHRTLLEQYSKHSGENVASHLEDFVVKKCRTKFIAYCKKINNAEPACR